MKWLICVPCLRFLDTYFGYNIKFFFRFVGSVSYLVNNMFQRKLNIPEPDAIGFTAIDELVLYQMKKLGLAHFIVC